MSEFWRLVEFLNPALDVETDDVRAGFLLLLVTAGPHLPGPSTLVDFFLNLLPSREAKLWSSDGSGYEVAY